MPEVPEQIKCLQAPSNPGNNPEDEGKHGADKGEEGVQATSEAKKKKQQRCQRRAVDCEKLPNTQLPFA